MLGPDGKAINGYHGMVGISDEHQSVFPPGTLNGNSDYLFFVATRVQGGAPSTSLVVLSGGAGPGPNGQWTLDFAKTDGYGAYPNGLYADIFVSSTTNCPTVANAANQDPTFDQDYAAPGSILLDPTAAPGSMLMIYEGTNTCLGSTGGGKNNFYSMVGAATSIDYGKTWPTYRARPGFNFVDLPGQNLNQGPGAPNGALGAGVCMGNSCATSPSAGYGRYPVLAPSVSIATAAASGQPLPTSMGDSEMSAFLDDASSGPNRYVYITYNYKPGTGALADPQAPPADLMIARGQLNAASAPLSFSKWNGKAFSAAGIGGYDRPVFPAGSFANCGAKGQTKFGSSISFVDATQQYLLLFVCDSPGDPAAGQPSGAGRGGAWFYSTSYDLSDPTQWSVPQEVTGSWSAYNTSGGCSSYTGFYPTAMSLGAKPGHLGTSGYIFYLWGCQTDNTPPPGRQYSSRMFAITLATPAPPPVTISTTQLPAATVDAAYSQALAATGGTGTYTWALSAGALPDGLTLSAQGVISGIPTTAGTASFTVQVTDSNGAMASEAFAIAVAPATLVLSPDGTSVYDTVNNVTWLADFNLAAINQFGLPVCQGGGPQPCVNASGSMRYNAAVAWVAAMNAANYLGQGNWQLPTTPFVDKTCAKVGPNGGSFGYGCTAGALDSIYNAFWMAPNTAVPIPNNAVGPFSNIQPYLYWSQSSSSGGNATFSFATGWEGANVLPNFLYIWPMIPGQIPGTPPASGNGLQVNPDGQTVYDPMTNIAWLANANLPAINTFGLPRCTDPTTPAICVAQDGAMTYDSATQFIAAMNNSAYLGQQNWQLPTIDTVCTGYKCGGATNPMGNLFYDQLGFSQGMSAVPVPNIALGPFHDIQPYLYWTCQGDTIQSACQTDGPSPNFEWSYSFGSGFEGTDLLANDLYVTAYFVGAPASPAGPAISTSPQLPAGTLGIAYSQMLAATGGAPPYTWSLAAGTLPAGLALTPDGTISGTPSTAGTYQFTVQVTDSTSASATLAVTLLIQAPDLKPLATRVQQYDLFQSRRQRVAAMFPTKLFNPASDY